MKRGMICPECGMDDWDYISDVDGRNEYYECRYCGHIEGYY